MTRRVWIRNRSDVNPTAEALHEWRKRVKYHRHHCDLLRDLWPRPMKARIAELQRLSDILGDDHDLAMLAQGVMTIGVGGGGRGRSDAALLALIERRRAELQKTALPLGRRLFAENTGAFRKRLARYWKARRIELKG